MKLLFVCNNMHIGGIQKSLLNLLSEIAGTHDVTLFLFYPEGEWISDVPENVRIVSGNRFTRILGMSQQEAKENGLCTTLWRSFWTLVTRAFGVRFPFAVLTRMQKLPGTYDAAISFMQNSSFRFFYGGCNEWVIRSAHAKKKISFVHCDFRHFFGNNPYNRSFYRAFDTIACVSDSCKAVFDEVCPQYAGKTVSVHNCFDYREMETLAGAYEPERTEGVLNILTAARISEEKGIFRMLPIFAQMKKKGLKFVWRVAGAGSLLKDAVAERDRLELSDCVRFLGMLDNPYPYFRSSDLLLVPSYDEAAPMVFGEAAFFGLPILTTDTTSARELVGNKGFGYVCENTDEAIRDELEKLLTEPSLLDGLQKSAVATNDEALREFENILK